MYIYIYLCPQATENIYFISFFFIFGNNVEKKKGKKWHKRMLDSEHYRNKWM